MHALISTLWGRMSRTTATGPHRIAASIRRGPVLWLTVCGGFLVAAIIIGTIAMVSEFRERALTNGERELENTVLLLARHFDQQLEDSEIVANDLISQMQISGIASPAAFKERMSTAEAHEMLRSRISNLSYIGEVTIFDSEGQMINSSAAWPVPSINVADREYFKAFKSNPQSDAVTAEPVRSYITGGWTTVIAHRLTGRNGVFLGAVTRRLDPDSCERFFASVALGPGAAISMFHRDGTMLARYPHIDSMIGKKLRSAPLLQNVLVKGGRQTLRIQSPVDHQDRLGSAAELSHFPLVIVATNTVAAALSDWREQTRLLIVAAALSASILAFILYSIVRQINRQNQESQRRLESEKHRLDTALNNMTQGLVLYDASARVVICNQRYIDMYGLSTEIAKPGCHFYDLIQHRKDTGSYDGDVHEFCSDIMRNVAQGKVSSMVMESGDGRAFLIVNKPLVQGGWVATIEDITERRNLEQERDRNYAFLRQIIDHIPTQITVKDMRDHRYVLANRVAETHFGLPCDAIVGKTASTCFRRRSPK